MDNKNEYLIVVVAEDKITNDYFFSNNWRWFIKEFVNNNYQILEIDNDLLFS